VPLLSELLVDLPAHTVVGDVEGVEIRDLAMRSDEVAKGALFFCVTGSSSDGHEYAADAIAAGAVALVVERELTVDVPQIVVENTRAFMGPMSSAFFGEPSAALEVFGVTGTNGKTTTAHLLFAMLEAAGRAPGLIGTVGARIGGEDRELGFTTPEAIDLQRILAMMVDAGNQSCSMEVSSHALEQHRALGTRFASVGFSNLTRDHLDYHRSFEAYYLAKRKLFETPGPNGEHWPAAINCDDEWGRRLFDELVHADRNEVPVWGYTLKGMNRASVSATYRLTPSGSVVHIESPVGDFTVESNLRGRFNVENVLCAATMALLAGMTPEQIQTGVANLPGVRGRFEPVEAGQPFGVFVDYAHTPDSLEQVLSSARGICDGQLIVVFGCGGDRDRSKRPRMGRVAASLADVAILTSDNPRSEDPAAIIAEVEKGMRRATATVVVEPDRRAAIAAAMERAGAGDVVIVAGKGHEQGQILGDDVVPFDDVAVAREALESLAVS
jgi:UDP-N-acetylmuramoyl-L-alanyl-D-glutamate--2,6-diaminopimelate ligase